MKIKFTKIVILFAFLLSACTVALQESAVQTAVSEVISTSSAQEGLDSEGSEANEKTESQADEKAAGPSQAELDEAKQQLNEAQIRLTDQAGLIASLQEELQAAQLSLTPKPTEIPTNTPTPLPSSTPTIVVTPANQKTVIATRRAAFWTYKDTNAAGRPIMIKVEPIARYETGDEFIVNTWTVLADGNQRFYPIVGPRGAGYYVNFDHVQDK